MKQLPNHTRTVFEQVVEALPSDREQVLTDLCNGDVRLTTAVRELLSAHDSASSMLDSPLGHHDLAANRPGLGAGDRCGGYELLEQIGDGGFGQVFAAQQQTPVRRKVAVKLIKPGMDTTQVLARFETERQALAILDHPSIARFLDAGATELGHPYFVMELVPGVTVTQFCDDNRLTVEERVRLMITVCEAIEHAHQKGIIHRDLKPSNVLVEFQEGEPLPKVIDFGVAKAIGAGTIASPVHTQRLESLGTPLYMSPEQARLSRNVDTRTDVYSLGLILYELLTGVHLIDRDTAQELGSEKLREFIQRFAPTRPSKRLCANEHLDEIADRRGVSKAKLVRQVRGDLDWIVMKALAKSRSKRYGSAAEFAGDLQRWLGHEAVAARPPSNLYVASRFLKRNLVACLAAASMLLILISATVFSVRQALVARAAEQKATGIMKFFVERFKTAAPDEFGQNVTIIEALKSGAASLEDDFTGDSATKAELLFVVGDLLAALGSNDDPIGLFEATLQIIAREEIHAPELALNARTGLARAYHRVGQEAMAIQLAEETLVLAEDFGILGEQSKIESLLLRGEIKQERGAMRDALDDLSAARRLAEVGDHTELQLWSMECLADYYVANKDFERAVDLATQRYDLASEHASADKPPIAAVECLASVQVAAHRPAQALALLTQTLPLIRERYSEDNVRFLNSLATLSRAHRDLGDKQKALDIMEEAGQIVIRPEFVHEQTKLGILTQLLSARADVGQTENNITLQQELCDTAERLYGADHDQTRSHCYRLGMLHFQHDDFDLAYPILDDLYGVWAKKYGQSDARTVTVSIALAATLRQLERTEEAVLILEPSLEHSTGRMQCIVSRFLGRLLLANGNTSRGLKLIHQGIADDEAMGLEGDTLARELMTAADQMLDSSLLIEAEAYLRRAIGLLSDTASETLTARVESMLALAISRQMERDVATSKSVSSDVADARLSEAERLALSAHYRIADGIEKERTQIQNTAAEALASLYAIRGDEEAAEKWSQRRDATIEPVLGDH